MTSRPILGLALVVVVGCSAPEVEAPPLFEESPQVDTPKRKRSAGEAEETDDGYTKQPPPEDDDDFSYPGTEPSSQPPTVRVWSGRVDRTATVRFGGDPYCPYDVTLSNIVVTVTLDERNVVTTSTVTATMTETTPSCPAPPLGTRSNSYTYRAPVGATPSRAIVNRGDPNNAPKGDVTLEADFIPQSTIRARLVFKRSGGAAPSLNWTVTTDVDLQLSSGS